MRALVLNSPGHLELAEIPVPVPAAGEILLRVRAATTCGPDLKAFRRGHPQIPMPGPFGHEYSGEVVAVGENAPFAVGDAVMGVHSAPCGDCYWCKNGQENLCESIMASKVLGSYAEFLLVPARIAGKNVFRKPEGLSFDEAALLEPFACVAQGIIELQKVGSLPAQSVLVIGPGAIGLMFVAALKRLGVRRVVLAGRNPARLEVGAGFGAETVAFADLKPESKTEFDVVIECTGMPEVWERAIDFPRRGGTLMLFGGCPGGTAVTYSTGRVHYDQITILSPFHFGTAAVRQARDWMAEGIDFRPLLSGVRSLEEATATFADLEAGRGLKYVFHP